jgi:hypothetical protein
MAYRQGGTTASVLSFSKESKSASKYPMTAIGDAINTSGYLYLCFLPPPYVDLAELMRKTAIDINPDFDDKEVFPLGAPVLNTQYILGAWPYANDTLDSLLFSERTKTLICHELKPNSFLFNDSSLYAKRGHVLFSNFSLKNDPIFKQLEHEYNRYIRYPIITSQPHCL